MQAGVAECLTLHASETTDMVAGILFHRVLWLFSFAKGLTRAKKGA
jgi:hypothetical protein